MDHLEALQVARPAAERARSRVRTCRLGRGRRACPVLQARREEDCRPALVGARGEAHGDDARGKVVALLRVGYRRVSLEYMGLYVACCQKVDNEDLLPSKCQGCIKNGTTKHGKTFLNF